MRPLIDDCSQLDEVGIGKYFRRHGIYRQNLEQWKVSLMNDYDILKWEKIQAKNKSLHKQNLLLEKVLKKPE